MDGSCLPKYCLVTLLCRLFFSQLFKAVALQSSSKLLILLPTYRIDWSFILIFIAYTFHYRRGSDKASLNLVLFSVQINLYFFIEAVHLLSKKISFTHSVDASNKLLVFLISLLTWANLRFCLKSVPFWHQCANCITLSFQRMFPKLLVSLQTTLKVLLVQIAQLKCQTSCFTLQGFYIHFIYITMILH